MQKLSPTLYNIPIFSLQTGHQIGIALRPLINPSNLKIEAWFAESQFERGTVLLPIIEIREMTRQGIAVNDRSAITPAEDLVRLKNLINLDYQLIGKKVDSETKVRLGKVSDYATDMQSFYIQRLFVTPGALKITSKQKVVARTQIVEINDKRIIVKDTEIKANAFFRAPAPAAEG